MSIPKITHQIWFQGWDKLPEEFNENVQRLHSFNPGYTHMKWDEKTLRTECLKISKECAAKFDSFELMIMKIDFGRYIVLYNYGGISVDTDMYSIKSIDNTPGLDKYNFIISLTAAGVKTSLNNAVILCTKENDIMLNIIQNIIQNDKKMSDYFVKELYVSEVVGPWAISSILNKYTDRILLLDNKYYEPCYSINPYCKIDSITIMDHRHKMSWISDNNKNILFLLAYIYFLPWFYIYMIIFVLFTILLYTFRRSIMKTLQYYLRKS